MINLARQKEEMTRPAGPHGVSATHECHEAPTPQERRGSESVRYYAAPSAPGAVITHARMRVNRPR
jgi:hypothetical protein